MRPDQALFIGQHAAGISYCDKRAKKDGDYKRVAFLSHRVGSCLQYEPDCPDDLRKLIYDHAMELRAQVPISWYMGPVGHGLMGAALNKCKALVSFVEEFCNGAMSDELLELLGNGMKDGGDSAGAGDRFLEMCKAVLIAKQSLRELDAHVTRMDGDRAS